MRNLRFFVKNIIGWKTKRKIVVFSVDDYGNIRLASKKARDKLDKAGLKIFSRFDKYDALETREDLEYLFETLTCVKDKNNRFPVFTPLSLPCNINFDAVRQSGYKKYIYEELPETFKKLEIEDSVSYKGTWDLWKEGIRKGLMNPQFHGREHINLSIFNSLLEIKDKQILTNIDNNSYTSIDSSKYFPKEYTAAYTFWDFSENKKFEMIISDGLDKFKDVFGYNATHFTSPAVVEHPILHEELSKKGIKYIDGYNYVKIHQGQGKYKLVINYMGNKTKFNQKYFVRNCVFEPTSRNDINWVDYVISQMEAAFFWNKPVIISSHRINFCGHIDTKNRKIGINNLKMLLKAIVKKWPDIEFMSTDELGNIMSEFNE